ncbi:EAL domain-containing protein [Rhodoferax sp.]|uniref:bifunctional diguanylate cyclase/phosphodiesterase n=1 Tax=Rhodoferax sp. TaxID=50421 RepID=UPI00271A4FA8|nr:EAL domain-containing protein [Rhodoferax sp.]MDO9198994.1 EAL domain-containing protein [Rhodoferax sp.]
MALTVRARHSVKTRITLTMLVIFLVGLWSLSYYASQMLRKDMEGVLGEQQFSTVSHVAESIGVELDYRLQALSTIAGSISPAVLGNAEAMQARLAERLLLQRLFNGGVIVFQLDGTRIAEFPRSEGRVGVNYVDVDTIAAALKQGKSTIGRPAIDKKLEAPVFGMTVPIRDLQGNVIGALSGVTNLGQTSFLDRVTENRYGKSGGYLLIAPQQRQIITATDKSRALETYPAAGIIPLLDRMIQGYEGSGVAVNPRGVEVLVSAKGIPAAGWVLSATLPTAEAFAPIRAMQQRMLLATLILTLLASGLTWWMVGRQLTPMLVAAKTLANMSDINQPAKPLVIERQDEIGQLIGGFNRLLETLGQRTSLLKQILDTSSVAIFLVDPQGRITQANQRMAEMFGYPLDALEGIEYVALVHPSEREVGRQKMLALLASTIGSVDVERRYWRADHTEFWGHLTGQHFTDANGVKRGLVGVIADITKRRQAEEALRIAATAFESQEGILVTDITRVILRVNQAFTAITGYTADEAVGQNPRLLSSGRHDAGFFAAMTHSLEHDGKWHGEIWNRRRNGEVYPQWLTVTAVKDDAGRATHYVGIFTDITARKMAEDEIESLAFFDPLTRMPNRRLLMDRLEQALAAGARRQRKGALLFVDLDNFKTLNDTLGHDTGDLLLEQVARRLAACVREGDTVARLGGDEFVVLLEDLSENAMEAATQAEAVGEKILTELSQSYRLASQEHHSTASIGITLFGEQQEGIDEPLKRADLAMYQAKAAGRNTVRFFDPQMQAVVTARAELETGLREAVAKNQFLLHYQAQVTGERRVTGAEALVRWQHPQRGMVSPAEFIPLAEETGLILPLGRWVLESACTQLALWATRADMAHLTVSVNVSPRQFHQRDLVEEVLATLERTGANPHRLKLELTESLLVSNIEDVIGKMHALKGKGVGFSLDDFGTGYSSLSYLKRLPLDQLKIDQGFVRDILIDPNDAAIARMVVALANSLGLTVIAEGVETAAQRDFLASQGCHAYQGYLFSRPLPLDEFEAFARRA